MSRQRKGMGSTDDVTCMQPIQIKKSYAARYQDLVDVLGCEGELPASQMQAQWTFYVELAVEPVGWQAIWKLPRQMCQTLGVAFPTMAVVMVEGVNSEDLSANVVVTAAEDDCQLPNRVVDVSLMHLYPTKMQENTVLNIFQTATCLDHLRLFYNHLWRPWDLDEIDDWITCHLESRLKLYYDMAEGKLSHEMGEQIQQHLFKGRAVYTELKELEACINDDDALEDDSTLRIVELHQTVRNIKNQLTILENQSLRAQLVRAMRSRLLSKRHKGREHLVVVCPAGPVQDILDTLGAVREMSEPDAHVVVAPLLQNALSESLPGDTVLLGRGTHVITSIGGLEEGGVISGLGSREATTIEGQNSGDSLLDFSGAEVSVANITVRGGGTAQLMVVRHGHCKLRNVCLMGGKRVVGVIVLGGAMLTATDCHFTACSTALFVDPSATASLVNCKLDHNKVGIQLALDGRLMMDACTIADNTTAGVVAFVMDHTRSKTGSIDDLASHAGVTSGDMVMSNNGRGDLVLKKVFDSHKE